MIKRFKKNKNKQPQLHAHQLQLKEPKNFKISIEKSKNSDHQEKLKLINFQAKDQENHYCKNSKFKKSINAQDAEESLLKYVGTVNSKTLMTENVQS